MESTSVVAEAVNTVIWLRTHVTTVAVPVYQRQYRWDQSRCQRLVDDIRTIADSPPGRTHFLGSVLATTAPDDGTRLTLIDGQQRITTLTLIAAALHRTLLANDLDGTDELRQMLTQPTDAARTKLIPHQGSADDLTSIVFGQALPERDPGVSALVDNWAFLLLTVQDDADRIWRGLRRLEHVTISLTEDANPQQIFESLNATAAPLRDHELIHNYMLMGLPHGAQIRAQNSYWLPIEENTGEHIDAFWRDYLTQRTGWDGQFQGEHGVYEVFRSQFPRPNPQDLEQHSQEWLEYSRIYQNLLDPIRARDADLAVQLGHVNTFGTGMYPIVMAAYRDHWSGVIDHRTLLTILEQLQALHLRRMVVGISRDHLAAQLCRIRLKSGYPLRDDIARRTPGDERVARALRHRSLPLAGYVLQRLQGVLSLAGLEIEHIFPQTPDGTWTGDGERQWASLDPPQQAQYRELLNTLGNLTLLEQPLNAAAGNRSFADKRRHYAASKVSSTASLTQTAAWNADAIEARTSHLTERFLTIWRRPPAVDTAQDELVPILDVARKPGHYVGWKDEFEYVMFGDEQWEVHDVKTLFSRVYQRLWMIRREDLLVFGASHDSPIRDRKEWNSRWEPLGDAHYLFMGLFPQYALASVQSVLEALDLADSVWIKYNPDVEDE